MSSKRQSTAIDQQGHAQSCPDLYGETARLDFIIPRAWGRILLEPDRIHRLGISFERTGEKVRELEALVRARVPDYDLLNVATRIGHHDTDLFGVTEGRNPAWALITVHMLPQGERKTNSNDVIALLREEVGGFEGYKSIIVKPLEDAPVAGQPVEMEIIGNSETRFELADILTEFLEGREGVTEVWTSYKQGKDVVNLRLDHEALADRGLTVADVIETVRIAFDGRIVAELQTVDETLEYRLQFRPQVQGKLETLRNLTIINRAGLLPAAYGLGGSEPYLTPMTMVMVWGLLFGTFVTLILLPCLYAVDQDIRRVSVKLVRRVAGKGPA